MTAWGIEHNEQGWRADAYLYCNEVTCPECGWRVPLAPSWVIGEKSRCIAELHPDAANQRFDIHIASGVSSQKMTAAKTAATVKRSALACPHCGQSTPMAMLPACDHLVPLGFDQYVWKTLAPDERFYLKGLDLERHGEYRAGAYQELARGFGIKDYKPLLAGSKANQTRLKTASEFGAKVLDEGFGVSLVRHALFAVRETTRTRETLDGKTWLRTEGSAYWQQRKNLITILRYLSAMGFMMPHWQDDANSARLLAGALENDSV